MVGETPILRYGYKCHRNDATPASLRLRHGSSCRGKAATAEAKERFAKMSASPGSRRFERIAAAGAFSIQDHHLGSCSRLSPLEAVVVLKPLRGPRRGLAVPVVFSSRGLASIIRRFRLYRGCNTSTEIGRGTLRRDYYVAVPVVRETNLSTSSVTVFGTSVAPRQQPFAAERLS